jgi:hypothetical protein
VNKEKTLQEIESMKQTTIQEHQLSGPNDFRLEQKYLDKKQEIQNKLSEQKNATMKAHSNASKVHNEQIKKNLTGLAVKKALAHVGDAVEAAQESLTSFINRIADRINHPKNSNRESNSNQTHAEPLDKTEDE